MSIASNLSKLEEDLTNAYESLGSKGATIPSNKNTNNLSDTILSVPSGTASGDSKNTFIKVDIDTSIGAIKWLRGTGSGTAEPCTFDCETPITSILTLDANTQEVIYEKQDINWSEETDLWIPLFRMSVQECDENAGYPFSAPKTTYACIRFNEDEYQYEFCMMDSFGEYAQKTFLELGKMYIIQREAMHIFTDSTLDIIAQINPLALAITPREFYPDPTRRELRYCKTAYDIYNYDGVCPVAIDMDFIYNIRRDGIYTYIAYTNDVFIAGTAYADVSLAFETCDVSEGQYSPVSDAYKETIVWE